MRMARYFVELAYKGTRFHGWQVQPNAVTVQELLDKALSTVLKEKISTTGSGRTDTGVHAVQQFAHFDIRPGTDPGKTLSGVNALLPCDIAVKRFIKVHDTAHARYDAVSRTYHYHVHFQKDPFREGLSWKIKKDFDLDIMNEAAGRLLKHTDFSSFCKSHAASKSFDCLLSEAGWQMNEEGAVFRISANRFLRNMVRAVVGTLLLVGRKKISLKELDDILRSKDRSEAGESVPAEGLYLVRVEYPYL